MPHNARFLYQQPKIEINNYLIVNWFSLPLQFVKKYLVFRLKTLSLGYSLPKSWVTKVGMNSVTLNLSGYNLFEISGVPDVFDPESISSSYPMMRSVSVGAQINF